VCPRALDLPGPGIGERRCCPHCSARRVPKNNQTKDREKKGISRSAGNHQQESIKFMRSLCGDMHRGRTRGEDKHARSGCRKDGSVRVNNELRHMMRKHPASAPCGSKKSRETHGRTDTLQVIKSGSKSVQAVPIVVVHPSLSLD
jgi:hypothetical protein